MKDSLQIKGYLITALLTLPILTFAQPKDSVSESIKHISNLVEENGECEWVQNRNAEKLNSSITYIADKFDVSTKYTSKGYESDGQPFTNVNDIHDTFSASSMDSLQVRAENGQSNTCEIFSIALFCSDHINCVQNDQYLTTFYDSDVMDKEKYLYSSAGNRNATVSIQITSFDAVEKIVDEIKHLWSQWGLELSVTMPTIVSEDLFGAFDSEPSTGPSREELDRHRQLVDAETKRNRETREAEEARELAEQHRGNRALTSGGESRPMTSLEQLTSIGRIISDGSLNLEGQIRQDTHDLAGTAGEYAAEQEAERQRQSEQQAEQRRVQEEQNRQEALAQQERQREESERQRREQERQRRREEDERLTAPDNILGQWVSKTNGDGEYGRYSIQGSSGFYSGTFSGRVRYGDNPPVSYKVTIRNLHTTHEGSWNTYEGEVDCETWTRQMGNKGGLNEPWRYIRLNYYPYNSPQPEVTSTWGCHMADPPDMRR